MSQNEASRVPVLMYHRIDRDSSAPGRRHCVSPDRFGAHMRSLKRGGMHACSVEDFVDWLDGARTLPEGSFVLTFDDGYAGVYQHAFPLLSDMGWSAAIFLVTGMIGGSDAWSMRRSTAQRSHPLLGDGQIREMAQAGFSFHSHTRTHPDLRQMSFQALDDELRGARRELEDLLGRPVQYLAYPFGWYDDRVVNAVAASGYRAAFSVHPGFNRHDVDRYRIRRLDVYGSDSAAALLRKVALGSNDGSWSHSLRYYATRLGARLGIATRSDREMSSGG